MTTENNTNSNVKDGEEAVIKIEILKPKITEEIAAKEGLMETGRTESGISVATFNIQRRNVGDKIGKKLEPTKLDYKVQMKLSSGEIIDAFELLLKTKSEYANNREVAEVFKHAFDLLEKVSNEKGSNQVINEYFAAFISFSICDLNSQNIPNIFRSEHEKLIDSVKNMSSESLEELVIVATELISSTHFEQKNADIVLQMITNIVSIRNAVDTNLFVPNSESISALLINTFDKQPRLLNNQNNLDKLFTSLEFLQVNTTDAEKALNFWINSKEVRNYSCLGRLGLDVELKLPNSDFVKNQIELRNQFNQEYQKAISSKKDNALDIFVKEVAPNLAKKILFVADPRQRLGKKIGFEIESAYLIMNDETDDRKFKTKKLPKGVGVSFPSSEVVVLKNKMVKAILIELKPSLTQLKDFESAIQIITTLTRNKLLPKSLHIHFDEKDYPNLDKNAQILAIIKSNTLGTYEFRELQMSKANIRQLINLQLAIINNNSNPILSELLSENIFTLKFFLAKYSNHIKLYPNSDISHAAMRSSNPEVSKATLELVKDYIKSHPNNYISQAAISSPNPEVSKATLELVKDYIKSHPNDYISRAAMRSPNPEISKATFELVKEYIKLYPNSDIPLEAMRSPNPEISKATLELVKDYIKLYPNSNISRAAMRSSNPEVSKATLELVKDYIKLYPNSDISQEAIRSSNPEISKANFELVKEYIKSRPNDYISQAAISSPNPEVSKATLELVKDYIKLYPNSNISRAAMRSSNPEVSKATLELVKDYIKLYPNSDISQEAISSPNPEVSKATFELVKDYIKSHPNDYISHAAIRSPNPEVSKATLELVKDYIKSRPNDYISQAAISSPNPEVSKATLELVKDYIKSHPNDYISQAAIRSSNPEISKANFELVKEYIKSHPNSDISQEAQSMGLLIKIPEDLVKIPQIRAFLNV